MNSYCLSGTMYIRAELLCSLQLSKVHWFRVDFQDSGVVWPSYLLYDLGNIPLQGTPRSSSSSGLVRTLWDEKDWEKVRMVEGRAGLRGLKMFLLSLTYQFDADVWIKMFGSEFYQHGWIVNENALSKVNPIEPV